MRSEHSRLVCAVKHTNACAHTHTHTRWQAAFSFNFTTISAACVPYPDDFIPPKRCQCSSVCMDFTLCQKSELGFSFYIFRVHIFVKPQNLYQEYSEIRCSEEWLQRGDTYDFRHKLAGSFQAICYIFSHWVLSLLCCGNYNTYLIKYCQLCAD